MHHITRNAAVFVGVAAVWIFLFVQNPWMNFNEVQGHERFPRFVYFSLPVVLATVCTFMTVGGLLARIGLAMCIPLLHFALCVLTWATGLYGGENLVGAYLM